MKPIAPMLFALPLAMLGACGPSESEREPGEATVGEARALEEAAEMIEQRRLPADAAATPAGQPSAPTPAQGE